MTVQIAGRSYSLACKEGGEAHLESLAADVGTKVDRLVEQLGPMHEPRLLLMAALMLADELRSAAPASADPAVADPALAEALATIADRAEALAQRLEAPVGA
ncbi:cell division protein ZapA [Polymorphobacter sp.]|uniref:cell division protein ZapA n=1 Tax=Polymorphobacter sp. TaxID=1909290 RepID=UPI003F7262E9